MPALRVQLGAMPAMLADMVVQLLGERLTVEIAGRTPEGGDALEEARAGSADLLVVVDDDKAFGGLGALLAQSRLAILAVSDCGERGDLVRLARQPVPLDRSLASALSYAPVAGVA